MFLSRSYHCLSKPNTLPLTAFVVFVITTITFNTVLTVVFRANDDEDVYEMTGEQFARGDISNVFRDEMTSLKNGFIEHKLDELLHTAGNSSDDDNTLKHPAIRNISTNYDTERRLRFVYKMMTPYLASLNRSREIYQEQSFPSQREVCTVDVITNVASAKSRDYFHLFETYFTKSTTLIFEAPLDIFGEGLLKDYYHPSSNNCSLMHSNTRMEQDQDYGCNEDISKTFKSVSVEQEEFLLVFPPDFQTVLSRPARVRLLYIHVIRGGVVTEMGDVISGNSIVRVRRCNYTDGDSIDLCPSIDTLNKVDEVFVADAFPADNFYHTNAEGVARIAPYLHFLRQNPEIKIHAADYFTFFPLLDIPRDRLVSGPVVGRIIYLPSGTCCARMGFLSGQLLSLNLQTNVIFDRNLPRNVVILIKRSLRRYFGYHDDILAMLKKYTDRLGLVLWVFRDDPLPSLDETREMFYRALIVVAPHGAGQINMLFSQPATILIEGLCPHKNDTDVKLWNIAYLQVMKRLGMRYYALAYPHFCERITAEEVEKPFVKYLALLGFNL